MVEPETSTAGPESLSSQAIPAKKDWRDHVVHVEGPFVTPKRVTVEGDEVAVKAPDDLQHEGGSVTTLTTSDEHSTTLIIDLGRIAMGYVELGIENASGAPIRASYAQFRQFLGPEGDGMSMNFGTDAHPWSRVDIFDPPSQPTVLESPGKREMRYIGITLDGPGEAVIDYVRIRQTIYPVRYDGYFLSSDELLNRAWYSCAYTGDLATISEESSLPGAPEGASPWMVTMTFDRIITVDLQIVALAGYNQSSDYRWLMRNTLQTFARIQKPDGSLPAASSHLVNCQPGDPGPPDGWRWPEEGPDPDLAVGMVNYQPEDPGSPDGWRSAEEEDGPNSTVSFAGDYSLFHDLTIDTTTANWVSALADYYLYTGDVDFVRPLLPVARRAIGFLRGRTTEDGLYYEPQDRRSNPDAEVPWVANWSPRDIATGVDSFANAAYYDATKGLALLEEGVAGRSEEAQRLRDQAEDVRAALIAHLWDPEVGAMVLNDEDPLRDHTGDANAGNLTFRTLDPERARATMEFLATTLATPHGTTSSEFAENPYRYGDMQGYIQSLEALGRVRYGDGEGAVDLIRRCWGHMLENGPGTTWFLWNNDGSVDRGYYANTSWTTALPALSEGILGVRPTAAGFRRWIIAPQPSGLNWAEGRVPVPGGGISVRWRRTGSGGFHLTVETPEGSGGEVAVPLLGKQREIAVDGEIVWREGRPVDHTTAEQVGDAVVFGRLSGNHTFAWGQE
jgi:alpha-L-rhamnosidase